MGLIPCSENCVYQNDGYCLLETTALVTSETEGNCVHYINKNAAEASPAAMRQPPILKNQKLP